MKVMLNKETSSGLLFSINKEISELKYALDEASIVAITDQKGIIQYVNQKFCMLSKYSKNVQIYSAAMDERSYQSFLMERDLRKALKNDEFIVYYQPRVDSITKKIIGAEALIRWNHPKFGLIPPGDFIPLAEETGLILPMGKWVKRKVCEQLAKWQITGIPLLPISILFPI